MAEQVNHPKHYNARPDGLECIDIIRHYTFDIGCAIKYLWRAGLKTEDGMTDREKEIEDLKKAIWYINDELYLGMDLDGFAGMDRGDIGYVYDIIEQETGYSASEIANFNYYEKNVANAMLSLLQVGLVSNGYVYRVKHAVLSLREAIKRIQARIDELEAGL